MKAMNGYVVVELVEEKSEIIRPSGIVLANDGKKIHTNNGDEVNVKTKYVVYDIDDEHSDLLHKEVVINLYECQLFNFNDKIYGVVPFNEIKVVL